MERRELTRHYDILGRLPQRRLELEMVLRMFEDPNLNIPQVMARDAFMEASTIDTVMPLLIKRSERLGVVAHMDTVGVANGLEDMIKHAQLPPLLGDPHDH